MKPLILHSDISPNWYVATRYTVKKPGCIVTHTKYDVTDQMEAILERHLSAEREKVRVLSEACSIALDFIGENCKDGECLQYVGVQDTLVSALNRAKE